MSTTSMFLFALGLGPVVLPHRIQGSREREALLLRQVVDCSFRPGPLHVVPPKPKTQNPKPSPSFDYHMQFGIV